MRGKTLKMPPPEETTVRQIGSAGEYVDVLGDVFGLDLPEAAGLWPGIRARHQALFG
jgi:N-hydroxyarylamine O-acetyltransferase